MKKIKFLFVALLLGAVMPMSAQTSGLYNSTEWQGLRVSYGFGTLSFDYKDNGQKVSKTGSASEISIAYSKGIELSSSSPLFLELAPEISLLSCSDKKITISSKNTISNIGIAVPVNIGYLIDISDNAAISPYAGLNAKFNLTVKESYSESESEVDTEINYFENDEGGQRLQLGAQIGCGLHINRFYAGLSYNFCLTPIVKPESFEGQWDKEMNSSSIRLTLGFNF